ncbi:MAG: hypothetical protein AAF577_16320 [Pseudomonadota bacterium]
MSFEKVREYLVAVAEAVAPSDPFFWAALWLMVCGWVRLQAGRIVKSDGDRTIILRFFEEDRAGAFYRRNLAAALDWLDGRLDPGIPPRDWPTVPVQRAWSGLLFDLTLVLAVVYPVFLLILQWIWTGEAGQIGSLVVLPANDDWVLRGLIAVALIVSVCFATLSNHASRREAHAREWLFFLFAIALAGAVALALTVAVASALAVAGTVAFVFAAAGAGAGAVAGAVAGAGAVAVAVAVAGAVAGASAGASAFAVAGAFTVAVAFAFASAWIGRRIQRPAMALWLLVVVLIAMTAVEAAATVIPDERSEDVRSSLLFLALLPLANATADFLSIGLTRYLLRRSLAERGWRRFFEWAIDLALGLVILLALGTAIILGGHWIRLGGGTPIMDVAGTLQGLATDPWAYAWLIAGMATTVIPTLLHALLGATAAGVLIASRAIALLFPSAVKLLKKPPKDQAPRPVLIGLTPSTDVVAQPAPITASIMLMIMAAMVASAIVAALFAIAQIVLLLPVLSEGLLWWFTLVATFAGVEIPAP